ncbi:profilin, required for normal timing of actin polymerization in response to thermal stress [Cystobasidiomycetes sp. EMM_F5]
MVGTGKLRAAAIIGQQGGVWATSSQFDITAEQQATITKAFKSGDPADFQSGGIKLGKNKFMFLRQNDNSFYGKKGSEGCCVTKSKQAILIGEYPEGVTAVEANKVVEDLAAYLESVGF